MRFTAFVNQVEIEAFYPLIVMILSTLFLSKSLDRFNLKWYNYYMSMLYGLPKYFY